VQRRTRTHPKPGRPRGLRRQRQAPGLRLPAPLRRLRREDGAATAEYAVATLAAVGFAGLLVVILRSDEVRQMLTEVVRTALTLPG
jgi:Flp pilus assembly pilin Flp